jgi:short-subunit dehydrogenase
MPPFAKSVIVITGASSGLGRALALELAPQRPKLVLAARDAAKLEQVAAECRRRGAEALVVAVDLSEREQCQHLIERTAEHFGRLDVLVNNAGRAMWARFDELADPAIIEELMRLNYLGSVHCTHYALPLLKQSQGLIVAMASLSGLIGVPLLSGYAATKHAMIGFFESIRIELAASGVGVTIVAPDFVQSNILRRAVDAEGRPLEISPLNQANLLAADIFARRVVKAMRRRERLVLTSYRSRWARWGQLVAPRVVDWIAKSAVGFR